MTSWSQERRLEIVFEKILDTVHQRMQKDRKALSTAAEHEVGEEEYDQIREYLFVVLRQLIYFDNVSNSIGSDFNYLLQSFKFVMMKKQDGIGVCKSYCCFCE